MRARDEIYLWPAGAPGSEHDERAEEQLEEGDAVLIRNVVRPSLTPFLPDPERANGTAVVVAPGGGYHFLAWDYEGTEVARWLAERGVTAFLLKYRLADTGPTAETYRVAMGAVMQRLIGEALEGGVVIEALVPPVQRQARADAAQALRFVRESANEWGIEPTRVGFLGFSAGAFLASAVALSDDAAVRPDFVGCVYGGSAGEVPPWAPPMFAAVAADDLMCRRTTVETASKWMEAGRPVELHLYERGGHGFGTRSLGLPSDGWLSSFGEWMHTHQLL
jgi:acetyl esterase/lipase